VPAELIFSNTEWGLHCSDVIAETLRYRYAHGQYTPATVNRAGKIVGALGSAVDAAFHHNVCGTDVDESYRHRYDYTDDVLTFCAEYKSDRLFDHISGRSHSGFPAFMPDNNIVESRKLKQRLLKYCRRLDQMHVMYGRFK